MIDNANVLMLWGYIYLEEKDFEKALSSQERLLAIAESNEEKHVAHHQVAMVLREMGRYDEALQHITEEERLINKYYSEDVLKQAVNLYEQGYLNLLLNHLPLAEDLLEKSLAYAGKSEDLIAQACSHRGLGELYAIQLKNEKALSHFKASQALFVEADDSVGAAEIVAKIEQLEQLEKN